MTGSYVIPAVIACLAVLLFVHALIVRRRPGLASMVLLLSALGASAAVSRTLGFAMPIEWEMFPPGELELAAPPVFDEGTAIYLWVKTPDGPKAYRAPWSLEAAKQLFAAQREAEASGTGVRIEGMFDEQDGELVAHSIPPAALPLKQESAP